MADAVYDLCILTPSDVDIDVVGPAISGGRSVTGLERAINYTGGGLVRAIYSGIPIFSYAQHKEWSRLGGILNGSVRTVQVPLWADLYAARDGAGLPAGGPGGPANPVTSGAAALVGDTSLTMTVSGTTVIQGGEWFSIGHGGTIERRVYRVVETTISASPTFGIVFTPPLRANVPIGTALDFWRPECLMRLAPGETMASRFGAPGGGSIVGATFIEAF